VEHANLDEDRAARTAAIRNAEQPREWQQLEAEAARLLGQASSYFTAGYKAGIRASRAPIVQLNLRAPALQAEQSAEHELPRNQ
jgi:hypothetical protein